jgi:anti-sigma factor (TIGR02949 family)
MSATFDPCVWCEEVLQPYLDRQLTEQERAEAQAHLDECGSCAKRYRFEEGLRQFVRMAAIEDMDPQLKEQLASLRTPLL